MSEARFAVVGCLTSDCRALWIIEDRHTHDTATCPQCGSAFATDRFRASAQADEWEVACELRARIAADRAGQYDAYANEDDYGVLGERAEEHLARYDNVLREAVDDAAARQRRRQRKLFKSAAESYLNRMEPFQDEAAAYLERRRRELKELVDTPTSDATESTPNATVEPPAAAGLTLTTPESLPETADVRLTDPPISPVAAWKALWQERAMHLRLRDALHTLDGQTAPSAWATLTEDWGVTAVTTDNVPLYADYLHSSLTATTDRERWDVVRLTRLLGGSTAIGNTSLDDIHDGPVALFAGSGVTPSIAIHLTHAFFEDYQRNQRAAFLRFLTDLSVGFDIRLVCHGRILPKQLLAHHKDDLPASSVTDAPEPYRFDAVQSAGSPRGVAERAIDDLGTDHEYFEVLDVLCEAPSNRRPFKALRQDSTFGISENGVQKRVDRLREFDLVAVDQLNTDAFVQLLPAGEELLNLRAQERQAQARLDNYETVPDAAPTPSDASNSDVTAPPKPPNKSVCSAQAREGGGGSASDAWMETATVPADDEAPGSRCFWLPPSHQHAVVAACTGENGGPDIALADEPAPTREQPRDCWVGYDEDRKEVVVSIQPSPCAAYTVTRICAGLLSPLLRNTILTADDLDGEDGEALGALLEKTASTTALRNIFQLGCLPERSATGEGYREELTSELVGILTDVEKIQTEDGFNSSLARSVCQRAHGLAGTAMRIYELLGWSVTQEWTFPDYRYSEHKRRHIYLKTLAKHVAVVSRYGGYPAHRILYEDDGDIRADSLGCPNVDDIDPTGDCFGNWVLRGPGIDRLASDLTDLEAAGGLELQEDKRNYTPFLVELSIGQATRKETVEEAAERLCGMKDLTPTRPATALLAAFTDSVFRTTEALSGLATACDFERDITLDEIRFALGTLDPESLLPNLDTDENGTRQKSARSKIVHTLLTASEPLSTGEVADRAGVSKQSIRNHRDDLAALGLLEIDDRGVGKATFYRLRLPFRDERRDCDAPRPLYLPDGEGEESMHSVRDVAHDLIEAHGLLDEAYADDEISDGLVGWPPTLEPAIERWPWLRPWIDTIYWLFGQEGGGSLQGPSEWIEGPYEFTSRFGSEPATTQAQLLM